MLLVAAVVAMVFLIAHGLGVLAWIGGGLAGLAYLRWDVRRHPSVRCRVCTGSGGHQSRIGGGRFFRRPFGSCRCCGGRRSHPRLAARLLDPDGYQDEKRKIMQAREKI